jgi:hypothetical protein
MSHAACPTLVRIARRHRRRLRHARAGTVVTTAGRVSPAPSAGFQHRAKPDVLVHRVLARLVLSRSERRRIVMREHRRRRRLRRVGRELHSAMRALLVARPEIRRLRRSTPRHVLQRFVTLRHHTL